MTGREAHRLWGETYMSKMAPHVDAGWFSKLPKGDWSKLDASDRRAWDAAAAAGPGDARLTFRAWTWSAGWGEAGGEVGAAMDAAWLAVETAKAVTP
jgi:hypothetical protein